MRWRAGGVLAWLLVWGSLSQAANLTFAWDAATDDVGVTGYRIYYRIPPEAYSTFVDVGNVLTGTVTGLTANTLYYFSVVAYDAENNLSPFSQEAGNMTGPTTPTAPTFLRLGALSCREVRMRWNQSFDDLGVTEYRLRRNGVQIGTTAGTVRNYDDAGVSPNTAYTYVVRAADASANESGDSNSLVLNTPACQ
jgi:chitodextrinase